MSVDPGLVEWLRETLAPLGTLTFRPMMGGATLYLDGIAFAITGPDGELWLKADAASDADWDAAGCERFSYTFKDGRIGTMNYRRAPDGVHDDTDEMLEWAGLALAAGQRAAAKRKPRKPKPART